MKRPKFSISILAMNKLEITRACLDSVFANSEDFELILTDNASTDGTAEYFESLKSDSGIMVRVIHNNENQGFDAPNRHALTLARGKYFICLNNDAEVPAGWLKELEKPLVKYSITAAISGPRGSCCSLQEKWPSFHGSVG